MRKDGKAPDQPVAGGSAMTGIEKWVRIALVASLGANIFLGGFVVARMLGPKPPRAELEFVDLRLRGLPQGLSSEMREELEHSLRAYRHEIRNAYGKYRKQQQEINELLVEEKLDLRAVAQAQQQLRRLNAQIQRQVQQALVDAVREMKAETRRNMIELRQVPRVRRFGRPESVDGARWRFNWRDGEGFQLDVGGRNMTVLAPPEPDQEDRESEEDSE